MIPTFGCLTSLGSLCERKKGFPEQYDQTCQNFATLDKFLKYLVIFRGFI